MGDVDHFISGSGDEVTCDQCHHYNIIVLGYSAEKGI